MKKRIVAILLCLLLFAPGLTASGIGQADPLFGDGLTQDIDAPNLTLSISPHNPPITLPPGGGTFNYSLSVHNGSARPVGFDVWTRYTTPDGGISPPIFGPARFRLVEGWSAQRDDLSEYIPGNAQAGIYTYSAYVGRFPGPIVDSASFQLEKLATAGWYEQVSGSEWPLYAVDFVDTETGWAVGFDVLATTDGGDNWYMQELPPIAAHFFAAAFVDAQTGWISGDYAAIAHTTDGGATWVLQDTGYPGGYTFSGLSFLDTNTGWAVGGVAPSFSPAHRVILKTADGGTTWETQMNETYEMPLSAVHFVDAMQGWAVGSATILHTDDGGVTWVPQTSGVTVALNDVLFVDLNVGWVVGNEGTILHTTDGGATWNPQTSGTAGYLSGLSFVDANTGWIAGGFNDAAGILHTTDGGTTWQAQDAGDTLSLLDIDFVDAMQGWATGSFGALLHTETGGN